MRGPSPAPVPVGAYWAANGRGRVLHLMVTPTKALCSRRIDPSPARTGRLKRLGEARCVSCEAALLNPRRHDLEA